MKNIDVLIVNYRTADLAIKAAESVISDPAVNQVIIIDSASPGDDCNILRSHQYQKKIKVICSKENLGFGQSNNVAAHKASAPYLFLINPDAELFGGSLSSLVDVLEVNPSVGIVAPKVFLPDKQTPQLDAQGIFPTAWRLITRQTTEYKQSAKPDWVSGVALMMRRSEFLGLGGFSPNFLMYFEDVELCWRYRQRGMGTVVEDSVKVLHLGGASKLSSSIQKIQYYASQDTYLELTGEGAVARKAVRLLRSIFKS